MGLLELFRRADINKEIENMKEVPDSVLLDVRTKEEYEAGHIPFSINIPVDDIVSVAEVIKDHKTSVRVYCLRGTRSLRAVKQMKAMGYTDVKSIGGIAAYKGALEK